jgi:hypothetical protein
LRGAAVASCWLLHVFAGLTGGGMLQAALEQEQGLRRSVDLSAKWLR